MTKTSREIQLLTAKLEQLLPASGGGGGNGVAEFVDFEQTDGDMVGINPTDVSSLEELNNNRVRIRLTSGKTHVVTGTYADVKDALEA